ncbi:hypothetical protein [Campylobacter curvus]|jgi:crossover junction endodeoxyribonuclease RuvC|uniref:hypothetical protein n=1 Tax=Campylobacter curvus TaxID=200 RepID=UPI0014700397|nr:hypothetical protein [Campylobacter curvus]
MTIIGIDPGSKGALCVLKNNKIEQFVDFNKVSLKGYIEALKNFKPDMVILESVHSMPKQGVKSMFSFGQRLGECEGILQALEIPYQMITPNNWQRLCLIPTKSDKKTIASILLKLYPNAELFSVRGALVDGRSDALGLAHSYRIIYKG